MEGVREGVARAVEMAAVAREVVVREVAGVAAETKEEGRGDQSVAPTRVRLICITR